MRVLLSSCVLLVGCAAVENAKMDSDGDGILDEAERSAGTDPESADSDDDGLSDGDEANAGTDPLAADSDGDGYDDKAEIDAELNPNFEWSHPYENGDYLVGACPVLPDMENAGPTGIGSYVDGGRVYEWDAYQVGDTLNAWAGIDSYEQEAGFYTFCGNYMLVTVSAGWCGPCQDLAEELAAEQEKVRQEYPNFISFELLYQNARGGLPTASVLADWRDTFGLDGVPVVAPFSEDDTEIPFLEVDGFIPTSFLVAPDMTVISMDEYVTSARDIKALIAEHMGE